MAKGRVIGKGAIFLLALVLLWVSGVWAAPTTAEQARMIVANWRVLDPQPLDAAMGQQVKDVQTFADASGPLYYVVYLEPAGLVFVPGDDLVEPIIAFAPYATVYDPSPAHPLGAVLNGDITGRVLTARQLEAQARSRGLEYAASAPQQTAQRKWGQMELGESPEAPGMGGGILAHKETISDERVTPFVDIWWDQARVNRDDQNSYPCYDYFTHWPEDPNNPSPEVYYPAGCTATAVAQLMRFHSHPKDPVDPRAEFNITIVPDGQPEYTKREKVQRGDFVDGHYDWDNMIKDPMHPATPFTDDQDSRLRAIGALTHDVGVSMNSRYSTKGTSTMYHL